MELFKRFLGGDLPKTAAECYDRGKAAVLAGHYREAVELLTKALEMSPGNVEALLERGKARTGIKDYKRALGDFDKVITLQPKNAIAYQRRAKVKDFLKDYTGALGDLDRAVSLQPNFAIAYYERGLIKSMAKKDPKGAEADFFRAGELGLAVAYEAMRHLSLG